MCTNVCVGSFSSLVCTCGYAPHPLSEETFSFTVVRDIKSEVLITCCQINTLSSSHLTEMSFVNLSRIFVFLVAWAMVDGGSNVKARSSYNEKTPRIIVSRSHAGKVEQVARQTFGNKTVIIPAGGAGLVL